MICPKCEREQQDGLEECMKCGIIFNKISPVENQDLSQAKAPWTPESIRVGFLSGGALFFAGLIYLFGNPFQFAITLSVALICFGLGTFLVICEKRNPSVSFKMKMQGHIIFFIIAAAISWQAMSDPSYYVQPATPQTESGGWQDRDMSPMALIMMEGFVKEQLKAPATADFQPGYQATIHRVRGQKYQIKSWVDAQNGFGAKIRNHFIGEVEQTSKDFWQLNTLTFSRK